MIFGLVAHKYISQREVTRLIDQNVAAAEESQRRHADIIQILNDRESDFKRQLDVADNRTSKTLSDLSEQYRACVDLQRELANSRAESETLRRQIAQNPNGNESEALQVLEQKNAELQKAHDILKLDSENIMSRQKAGQLVRCIHA